MRDGDWARDVRLVGRAGLTTALRDRVRSGAGTALHGPMGVGKTSVVRWLLGSLTDEAPVQWLQGTPGTSTIPFGSAAAALARSDPANHQGPDLAERLHRALQSPGSVCVLDDLHWIDDRSVGVVQQLLDAPRPPSVVATIRDGERLSPAAVGLLRHPTIERHSLEPLDAVATADLVAELLGGPPDRALLRTVEELAGGNPLYVTEMLASARADGTVVEEHGLWRALGPLTPSVILTDIVATRFEDLTVDARRSAELLAVAEGLTLDVAEHACGTTGLDELDRAGLLDEVPGPSGVLLQLAQPIYSEVLKAAMGRLTARAHRRALAAATVAARGGRGADLAAHDALRVARWQLDAGDQPDPSLVLTAAQQAHATYDLTTAETLARAAWYAEPTAAAGNLLAEVLHGQERFDEALAIVDQVGGKVDDDRERATLVALDAVARFHGERDVDGALRSVREARGGLTDPAARHALHVAEVYLLLMSERFDGLDAALAALAEECPPNTTPAMRQLVAGAHIIRGRTAEALALLDVDVLDHEDLFVRSEDLGAMADGLRALALTRAGRVVEAEAIGRATHPRCLDLGAPRARAAASYGLAMALLLRGDPAEALRWAADAVVAQEGILAPNGLLMAHALGLEAALEVGDRDRAGVERAALAELADTHERLYAAIGWRAEATARVVIDGDEAGGLDLLVDRAGHYARTGSPDYALDLAFRAVTLGAEPARALGAIEASGTGSAELTNPPLGGHRHQVLRSCVADDADGLEEAAEALEAIGCRVDARFAFERAGRAAARTGATRRATALHQRAAALALPTAVTATPGPGDPPRAHPEATDHPNGEPHGDPVDPQRWALLTPREEEVVRLAARGLQSKAIGEALHLSRRTVDHALQRAYPKLGVSGRAELVGRRLPDPPTGP